MSVVGRRARKALTMMAFVVRDAKNSGAKVSLLRELEESQWWARERLEALQAERLTRIVRRAVACSRFYRAEFEARGLDPRGMTFPRDVRELPILTKDDLRMRGRDLLCSGFTPEGLMKAKTGGSTGVPVTVYASERVADCRNASEMRTDRWAGWSPGMTRAVLWGNITGPTSWRERLKSRLFNPMIALDTMNINERSLEAFFSDWRRRSPRLLFGHAHSLYILAERIREKGLEEFRPEGIVATSMTLLPHERRVIEEVFRCPVTNRYGCEEVGLIGCECAAHQGFHLNAEQSFVEVLDPQGNPSPRGASGRIVVTDLVNEVMPLIRYELGDVGSLAARECSCGRGLPLLERLEGRTADFLVRKDGALVAGISLIENTVTAVPGISQLQIVQEEIGRFTMNVVRAQGYSLQTGALLRRRMRSAFGDDITVTVNEVQGIPQTASGKYRFAVCRIGNS